MSRDQPPLGGPGLVCAVALVCFAIATGYVQLAMLFQGRTVEFLAALGITVASLILAAYLVARSR